MTRPTRLRRLAALLVLCVPTVATAQPADSARATLVGHVAAAPSAYVLVTRVGPDEWHVDYTFDAPVDGVVFRAPAGAYRERGWDIRTPGVRLVERDGREALLASEGARSVLSVSVHRFTESVPDQYAPLVLFSDGAAALYLGAFAGDGLVADSVRETDLSFRCLARPGERVLAPAGAEGGGDVYAYFGPQEPVVSGRAGLIVDPVTPAWLLDTFSEVTEVTEAATRLFESRLGAELAEPPLVMIGAGGLMDSDHYSVKGGVVGRELVLSLEGRALLDASASLRAAIQRLTAHELAHLWQLRTLPTAFSDAEPWLHEGSAEALAIYALAETGLWTPTDSEAYATAAVARCESALNGRTLREALDRGSWDAVYACGLGLFWNSTMDPSAIWSAFVQAVADGHPFTQATLERVLTHRPD